jgi:hypothetical protein
MNYNKWDINYKNKNGEKVQEYKDKNEFNNIDEAIKYVKSIDDKATMIDIGCPE